MKPYTGISACFWNLIHLGVTFAVSSIENQLTQQLLANYTSPVRPVSNPDHVINVTFNMRLSHVLSVDERLQKVEIQCYYQMRWKNEFIQWNPQEWKNLDYLIFKPSDVWIPDILLLNSAGVDGNNIQKDTDTVRIYHNGENEWSPKVLLKASFIADTKYFPFDTQHFSFRFESWSLTESKLRILKDDRGMIGEHYVNSTEWEVVGMHKDVTSRDFNNETYADISFAFEFVRKPTYFVMTLIMPCIILVSIVLFSYFLPAASGERMGVVVTVLLGFAVFLEVVASALPQNSNSTSIFSVYILVTMSECAFSFFVTCIVITLIQNGKEKTKQPAKSWVVGHLLNSIKHKDIISQWKSQKYSLHDVGYREDSSSVSCNCVDESSYCSKVSGACADVSRECANARKRSTSVHTLQLEELNKILTNLEDITRAIKEEGTQNDIQVEWRHLADKVDRASFWIFLLIVLLSHCILFLGYIKCY